MAHGFRHRNVLLYPEYPDRRAAICLMMDALGYNIVNDPRQPWECAVHWEDRTQRERNPELERIAADHGPVINARCRDIRKVRVEAAFHDVFGYASFLDPLTHTGLCVCKSDRNARHDGRIIQCPVERIEPGRVYQKLLVDPAPDGTVHDYRIAICGQKIAAFSLRTKSVDDPFDKTLSEEILEADEFLSPDEQSRLLACCTRLGLDYGECDVIRHREDGRIYLLDVNNTPFRSGPWIHFPDGHREDWVRRTAEAFEEQFLRGQPSLRSVGAGSLSSG